MKLRESGMLAEDYWETLLDPTAILTRFHLDATTSNVAELGCGFGTFTLPLARRTAGRVHAIDIDRAMVERTVKREAALQHELDALHVLGEAKSRAGGQADQLHADLASQTEQRSSAGKSTANAISTTPAPFGRHVAMGVPAIVLAKPETRSLVLDERRLKAKAHFEPSFF